jgi:ATP-binding cassette, subfamily B, bacterial MsbA
MQNKYGTGKVLLRVFLNYIWPLKFHLFIAVIATFAAAQCSALIIRKTEPSINAIFSHSNFGTIFKMCILLFGISMVRGIFVSLENFCVKYMGHRILCNIQTELFETLVKTDVEYIQNQPMGHILSRFTNDIFRTKALFLAFFPGCFRHIFVFCFIVVEVIRMNLALSICLLSLLGFVGYGVGILGQKIRNAEYILQQKLAEYTTRLSQVFGSIKIVKAFSAAKQEIKSTNAVVEDIMQLYKKQIVSDSLTHLLVEFGSGLALFAILMYWGAKQGDIGGPGRLTAFLMAFVSLYRNFKGMTSLTFALQSGLAATIRVFKVLDERNENLAQKTGVIEISNPQKILFKNVTLKLQQSLIVNNCNLELLRGKFLIIVGTPGTEKASFVNLITGFIKASSGEILIEQEEMQYALSTISDESLAKNISLVTKDPCIFDATIAENISYGTQTQIDAIVNISKKLSIHDFISSLPNQYNTTIGHCGFELAHSEKQIICIARALLKNAPMILFEEACDALDDQKTAFVYNILEEIKQHKIILMTTKNIPLHKNIDQVLFLENGNLVTKAF